jgi:L,D-peptidoglycan transpeptidase YkuD (ErfK/YbiS/YcfS/YnhG family)
MTMNCSLGAAGIRLNKHEGDLATPAGVWTMRRVLYRADRIMRPRTSLPVRSISPYDGWCDDPMSRLYNRQVRLPFAHGHEQLWRKDHLYDLIVVLDHNDHPPVPGAGSAVFIHVQRPDMGPTHGCVAFRLRDLKVLLEVSNHNTQLVVPA